jgi:hypothetical protein
MLGAAPAPGAGGPSSWWSRGRLLWRSPWVRGPLLFLYYIALILALLWLYGPAHQPPPPPFIYQGF